MFTSTFLAKVFTSTFLAKNPLTRQTRRTSNRFRASLNGAIRNTFVVFCWNQSETILLQGSPELLISFLYRRRRALGRNWLILSWISACELTFYLNSGKEMKWFLVHFQLSRWKYTWVTRKTRSDLDRWLKIW